jgi:hypothetical protein
MAAIFYFQFKSDFLLLITNFKNQNALQNCQLTAQQLKEIN